MAKLVSNRGFAKEVGVTEGAVRKAIKAGKITDNCFTVPNAKGSRKIILELALNAWVNSGAGIQSNLHNKNPIKLPNVYIEPMAKGKGYIAPAEPPIDQTPETDDDILEIPKKAGVGITTAEAQRINAIHTANQKRLEILESMGKLVKKDKVYSALFAMGNELKSALLSIPDQHIGNIIAAKDAHEAELILRKVINDCLTIFTSIEKKEIKFNQK